MGSSTGQLVEAFDIKTSARLTISGSTVSIDPTGELLLDERYFLILPTGAFQDWTGNKSVLIDAYDFVAIKGPNVSPAFRVDGLLTGSILGGSGERTQEDTQLTLSTTRFAVDADGDALAFSASTPSNGTISISGNSVTYTPFTDFNGEDSFTLTVSDGRGAAASIPVTITVTAANDAPIFSASSQSVNATAGVAKAITLAATDVDGDALTYTVATPFKGSANISGSTLTYTPTASASGTDSFVVTARDSSGATATQTINVAVAAVSSADFRVTASDGWTGAIGGNGLVYGTSGYQDIKVLSGTVTFDASFNKGGDILRLDGQADSWTIQRIGSSAKFISEMATVTIPVGTVANWVLFADGARPLVYRDGSFTLGSQIFSESSNQINAPAEAVPPSLSKPNLDASAKLILSPMANVSIGGKAQVIGTRSDREYVEVMGGDLSFDPSFNAGGDMIHLSGGPNSWAVTRAGSSMIFTKGGDNVLVPIGTLGIDITFDNVPRALIYIGGQFKIGTQIIEGGTPVTLMG